MYTKLFDNDICVLYYNADTESYYSFINANKIYKIIHSDLNLSSQTHSSDSNLNSQYKTSFKKSQLAKNIHTLLTHKYSVILINNQYNVVAIHHPANKYNTYFIPF